MEKVNKKMSVFNRVKKLYLKHQDKMRLVFRILNVIRFIYKIYNLVTGDSSVF